MTRRPPPPGPGGRSNWMLGDRTLPEGMSVETYEKAWLLLGEWDKVDTNVGDLVLQLHAVFNEGC